MKSFAFAARLLDEGPTTKMRGLKVPPIWRKQKHPNIDLRELDPLNPFGSIGFRSKTRFRMLRVFLFGHLSRQTRLSSTIAWAPRHRDADETAKVTSSHHSNWWFWCHYKRVVPVVVNHPNISSEFEVSNYTSNSTMVMRRGAIWPSPPLSIYCGRSVDMVDSTKVPRKNHWFVFSSAVAKGIRRGRHQALHVKLTWLSMWQTHHCKLLYRAK